MRSNVRSSPSRKILALAGVIAATALLLSGCAGQPSPAAKALTGNAAEQKKPAGTTISTVSPAVGSVSGDGTVTISGTDLAGVKSVQIGTQQAAVQKASASEVVAVVPAAASFQPGQAAISVTTATGKAVTADKTYSYQVSTPVDKQLNYAMTYWKNYNSAEWGDLNSVGGDCANFVSQTLIARGWTQNDDWYNKDAAGSWSPAWGYVPSMDSYFRAHPELGLTEYPLDQRDKIKVGDIVMFDWNDNDSLDHVQIVSAVQNVNGKISIKMVGHNEDSDYRDLDQTITVDHPGAVGHFWSFSK